MLTPNKGNTLFLYSPNPVTKNYVYSGQSTSFLRHLLVLLDRLELQISNASDGCATGTLPAVPKASIVFFRTNRKTCHDYFVRIRPNIIAGAKIIGNDHLLIANATKVNIYSSFCLVA